ncbi:UNVERIFIED_CONTAM: amidohydrolase family protein [Microbacterium sp. SLM126]
MHADASVIHSAELFSGHVRQSDAWVRFDAELVTAVGRGGGWKHDLPPDAIVTDAGGRTLVPGFIDIHCHGGGGASVEEGATEIAHVLRTHRAHGTTRMVVSLVSAPILDLSRRLQSIARVAATEAGVIGAHLEGPFLHPDFRGAHDRAALIAPQPHVIDTLAEAAAGTLRVLTLAPELPGASAAIEQLIAADVAVAVGHTSCDFDTARRAFDAGATILTHAFNGMRGIHSRAPGPVVAAMRSPGVTLEVIVDGLHLDPLIVDLAFASAPDRIALVTDAMAAAGSVDGEYLLGSVPVVVDGGAARLADGSSIAGSTLTADVALQRAVRSCGVPFDQALRALTTVPAAAMGRSGDLGRLEPGFAADCVLLAEDLTVAGVWAAGARVA